MTKFIASYVGNRTFELRNRAKVLLYRIVLENDVINLYELQTNAATSFIDIANLVDALKLSHPKNGISKIVLLRVVAQVAGFATVEHISNGIYTTTNESVSYSGAFNLLVGTYEREIRLREALIEKLGIGVEKLSSMERAFIQFLWEIKDAPKEKSITRSKIDRFKIYVRANAFATNIARSKKDCKCQIVYDCESLRIVATIDLMFARADVYPYTGTPKITADLTIFTKDSQESLLSINAVFTCSDAMSRYTAWLSDFTKMLSFHDNYGEIEPSKILASIVQFVAES